METLFEFHLAKDQSKLIRLISGDLTEETKPYDLLICSAFKNRYWPTNQSLIGELLWNRNISVDLLADDPEIDMRDQGFWLSKETDSNFKRIGCIELLEYGHEHDPTPYILKAKYSTMRYVLEQAAYHRISVSKVAMPFLGVGEQNIELSYMACILFEQFRIALSTIDGLKELDIYEIDPGKASRLAGILKQFCDPVKDSHDIFISYCSKQTEEAERIRAAIEQAGFSCWMAPDSIPTGSSYLHEIPLALENTDVLVLILTPDAENSVWVAREVSTAVGARKKVLPYRKKKFDLGCDFKYLLEGVQILTESDPQQLEERLVETINEYYARRDSDVVY